MPLKYGSSQKTISSNIRELYNHGSKPRSRDQIIAIAMSQARRHPKAGGGPAIQGPPAGGAAPVPYIPDLPDTQTYIRAPQPPSSGQTGQPRQAGHSGQTGQQQPDPPQIGKWLAGEIAKTGKLPALPQGIKGGDITGATDMMMAADKAGLLTPEERSAAMKFLGITPQAPFMNPNGAPRYKQIRQGIETGGTPDIYKSDEQYGSAREAWPTSNQIAKAIPGLSSIPALQSASKYMLQPAPQQFHPNVPAHKYQEDEARGGLIHRALHAAHALAGGGGSGALPLTGPPGAGAAPFAGPIHSSVPGRTDQHEMSVKPGSYVMPADIVSILGEGNTMAGNNVIKAMFAPINLTGGIKMPPGHKGRYGPPSIMGPGMQAHKGPTHAKTNAKTKGHAEGGITDDAYGVPAMAEKGIYQNHKAWADNDEGDDENVPIIAAGGEVVIPPELIAMKFGSADHGHKTLDKFVLHQRAEEIKRLKTTPPPKK